jgi:hypothetical protein
MEVHGIVMMVVILQLDVIKEPQLENHYGKAENLGLIGKHQHKDNYEKILQNS